MNHILFIHHPSVSEHSGYSHDYAIMNNALMNIGVEISLQEPAFSSFWYIARGGIAASHGDPTLNSLRNHRAYHFSQYLHHFTFSLTVHRHVEFLYVLVNTC